MKNTKQTAKHTAGEWSIGKPDPIGARAFYTTKDGHASTLGYVYAYGGEGEANARLIASAPDLLDACESALEYIESSNGIMSFTADKLRKAIAKAKGE